MADAFAYTARSKPAFRRDLILWATCGVVAFAFERKAQKPPRRVRGPGPASPNPGGTGRRQGVSESEPPVGFLDGAVFPN